MNISNISSVAKVYESNTSKLKIEKPVVEEKSFSRVDSIKKEIENGTYKIKLEETAQAFAENLSF